MEKPPVAVRIDRAEGPPRWIITVLDGHEPFAVRIPSRGEALLLKTLAPGERDLLLGWWRVTAHIDREDLLAILVADVGPTSAAG